MRLEEGKKLVRINKHEPLTWTLCASIILLLTFYVSASDAERIQMREYCAGGGPIRGSQVVRTGFVVKLVALIVLTFSLGALLLVVVGSVRYGGLDDFVLRVRAEIAARRPHPSLVPTPIAYDAAGEASVLSPTSPLPTPAQLAIGTPDAAPRGAGGAQEGLPTATPARLVIGTPDATPLGAEGAQEVLPTATPAQTPGPGVSTPTPTHRPAAPSVELTGLVHMWQTWNNCGPATLAMGLSYFECRIGQADVAAGMRPDREDKNVSPEELAAFARSQGFEALVRVNGDADRLQVLLSNDLPVVIETWVEEEPGDGLGHYRLLTGYDDAAREWIAYDSYVSAGVDPNQPYKGIRLSYDEAARWWEVFNRVYVVIYRTETEPVVRSIVGPDYDDAAMWQRALLSAEEEVRQRPEDPFAWFNLGTDLVAVGQFERAAEAYDRARIIGLPWRMLWYQFGPFAAYYHTARYEELIALAGATIKVTEYVEEVHYWLGMGLRATGDRDGAAQAFRRALALNAGYVEAAEALAAIGE
jgi:tetratricopeptide (TPR) repeat protein